MNSSYFRSTWFAPAQDFEMLDRASAEELRTGVEVRQASCVCLVCPLPLFGVLDKGLAVDWLTLAKSLPGTALDSPGA